MEDVEICRSVCSIVDKQPKPMPCERKSRAARRRRMEIRKFKLVASSSVRLPVEISRKRLKVSDSNCNVARDCRNAVENSTSGFRVEATGEAPRDLDAAGDDTGRWQATATSEDIARGDNSNPNPNGSVEDGLQSGECEVRSDDSKSIEKKNGGVICSVDDAACPSHGMVSVCGRRREMEDAVSILPAFSSARNRHGEEHESPLHFFANRAARMSIALGVDCLRILFPSKFIRTSKSVKRPRIGRVDVFSPQWFGGLRGSRGRGSVTECLNHAHIVSVNNINSADELKAQLEALRREADEARARANSARARFMRLTEAADKLRLQAAASVKAGKENAARDLLLQKKKVMQALEKCKIRVELLDELSAKLGQAISGKETQLIRTLASTRFEIDIGKDRESPVRVVSPKEEVSLLAPKKLEDQFSLDEGRKTSDMAEKVMHNIVSNAVGNQSLISHLSSNQEVDNEDLLKNGNDDDPNSVFEGINTYQSFLIELDKQVAEMELKLHTFLKFSVLILEDESERLENQKVKRTMDILEALQDVRARIAGAMGIGETPI